MQSWKNNLTTKLSNPGMFVPGGGSDRFTDVKTSSKTHAGSTFDITLGRNSRTKRIQLIDYKLTDGDAVKDINEWLKAAMTTGNTLGNQAHAIVGSEPEAITPLENPNNPVLLLPAERLGNPHE